MSTNSKGNGVPDSETTADVDKNPLEIKPGCCVCCSVKKVSNAIPIDAVGDAVTHQKVVAEKAFDSTVKRIKGSFSWASAGLLGTATSGTISISFGDTQWETVLASWVYCIILFLITIFLQTCSLDAVDTPDSIGKELDTTVPPKKAKKGDKLAKYNLEKQIEKQKKAKTDRTSKGIARRVFSFAESTTSAFLENLASLATSIFANVVAIAVNSAVFATFKWVFDSDGTAIIALWMFALGITAITAYVAVRTGKKLDELEIAIYDFVYKSAEGKNYKTRTEVWENNDVLDDLIKFSAKKRFINLINYTLGLTSAWAWQDAFKTSILNAYEDSDTSSVEGLWTYVLVVTILVTFVNALSEKYYFLYPKDAASGFQLETQERNIIGTSAYKNLQAIVGIAWFSAVVESCDQWFDDSETVIALWVAYLLLLTGSIFGEYYWQTVWLKFEMIERGTVTAIYKAYTKLWDRDRVLENDIEEKEKSSWTYEYSVLYAKELIELTVFAWGVGAGWTASSAVKAILIDLYDGTFDPDTTEDITGDVLWSAWVAWFLTLIISTLVVWFLSTIQERRKKERQDAMKVAADADNMEKVENELEENENKENDDNNNDDNNEKDTEMTGQGKDSKLLTINSSSDDENAGKTNDKDKKDEENQ